MVSPIYGDSMYEIQEIVAPGGNISIKINILDYKRFLEKVVSIGNGGQISISKIKEESCHLSIKIINRDTLQTSKMLGGE